MNQTQLTKAATAIGVGIGLIVLYEKMGDYVKLSNFKKYGTKLKRKIGNEFLEDPEEEEEQMTFTLQRGNEEMGLVGGAVDYDLSANGNEEGLILYI